MADWQAFLWVAAGVLLSAVLPYAVTALWPAEPHVLMAVSASDLFQRIWPGVRKLLASLAVGGVVLAGALAAGYTIATWWEALLIGLAADRSVQVIGQVITRRYTL